MRKCAKIHKSSHLTITFDLNNRGYVGCVKQGMFALGKTTFSYITRESISLGLYMDTHLYIYKNVRYMYIIIHVYVEFWRVLMNMNSIIPLKQAGYAL